MPAVRLSTRQKIRLAQWLHRAVRAGRRVTGRPMAGRFRRRGLHWALELDEGIDFAIWLFGAFESDVLRIYEHALPAGTVVLDLGANVGAHTLPLARAVGATGRVIAVEATAWAYGKLQANLALNPALAARVTAVQALLVPEPGAPVETEIHSSWPLAGAAAVHPVLGAVPKSTAGARLVTVDQLVAELAPGPVGWIKLDVDGHELGVLRGAQTLLAQQRPTLIMELAPYCHPGDGFEQLVRWLVAAGYTFFRPESRRPLPTDPEPLRRLIPTDGSINVLARPGPSRQ